MIWQHKNSFVMQLRQWPFQKTFSGFGTISRMEWSIICQRSLVSTVVSSAARPVVKKIVIDQRDGKNSFYAMTDGAIFEYDRDKCSVTDWFALGIKGKKKKKKKNEADLWQRRKVARSWSSEVPTTDTQHETSYQCLLLCNSKTWPHFFRQVWPPDQRPEKQLTVNIHYDSDPWRKQVPVLCDMTTPTYGRHHVPKPTTQSVTWKILVYTMNKSWFMDYRTENGACVWTVVNSMASMLCIPLYIPRAFREQLFYYFLYAQWAVSLQEY